MWAISRTNNDEDHIDDDPIYTIRNGTGSDDGYLTAPTATSDNLQILNTAGHNNYSEWTLERYEGNVLEGAIITTGGFNTVTGKEIDFDGYMYSSKLGVNGPLIFSVSNTDDTATNKATIDSANGVFKAIVPGQVRMKYTFLNSGLIWWRTINIAKSMEGTYYFLNFYGGYMQPDDDNINVEGAELVLRTFNYNNRKYQKWRITHVGEIYYIIESVQNGKVATAPSSTENEIIQKVYTGDDNQKWVITQKDNGLYNISSKVNSNNYMAADDGGFGINKKYDVDLRANKTDAKGSWYLAQEKPDNNDAFFLGIDTNESGHDHYSYFPKVMYDAYLAGIRSYKITYTNNITKRSVINTMKTSGSFVFRGHGEYNSDRNASKIILNSSNSEWLYSDDLYDFENNAAKADLSKCEFMLFIACETAKVPERSLPVATVRAGAKCAVGFKPSIYCYDANKWLKKFFEIYNSQSEHSAEQAAIAASKNIFPGDEFEEIYENYVLIVTTENVNEFGG